MGLPYISRNYRVFELIRFDRECIKITNVVVSNMQLPFTHVAAVLPLGVALMCRDFI